MLFKIINQQAPNYLYDLLPKHNAETVSYSLRNNEHIKLPMSKKELFRRSFFPSAIRLWNKLKTNVRNAPSLHVLKLLLKKEFPDKPTLYYYGERWTSVHHSRLRMQCSKLHYDLHCKLFVRDNSICSCGAAKKTACHFFMHCPLYEDIRAALFNAVSKHTACNIETFLYGDNNLSIAAKKVVLVQFMIIFVALKDLFNNFV